jgi:ABC-type transport system involved in Fe-S cluster assembly fused permease/ATPase subunit
MLNDINNVNNYTKTQQVQQRSVRRAIGVVPQDTVMFNDSILHNLKYGKLDATMAEVEAAAEAAQVRTTISNLLLQLIEHYIHHLQPV